ncbi:MAG: tetratricopeptide repeat protein [Calditrichaeota bacterium]|nr:tetratricopeptide repeat protein [Calditrichota bacterium]
MQFSKVLCIFAAILFSTVQLPAQQESNDFSYALKLYNEGFYDISAQQFSNFLARYPGSERLPEARYYFGDALFKLNEIENARIEFQALAVSFPDHQRAPQGWFRAGECYELLNKPEEAAKAFETVKILYPNDASAPRALLRAGEALMKVEQFTRAEQIVREFLNRYVESAEYQRGRVLYGKILFAKGEPERANGEFESVLKTSQDPAIQAEAKLGQAIVFKELGFSNRAEQILTEVVQKNGGSEIGYSAVNDLGELYIDSRRWENAITLLQRETDKYTTAGKNEPLKLMLAQANFLKQDYFQARTVAQDLVISNNPQTSLLAKFYVASSQLEEGRITQAEPALKSLTEISAETDVEKNVYRASLRNLIRLHVQKNEIANARTVLGQYQNVAPNDAGNESLHRELVERAFAANQLSAGVDEMQRYRGSYPNSNFRDELLFVAGKSFFANQQYDRSLIYFEQIVDEYPASAKWDSSLTYRDFIRSFHGQSQNNGVKELARMMGQLLTGVDRKALLFDLGKIYLSDLRDYREAAKIFEKYVTETQDSVAVAEGWYYLSESYLRQAEYESFMNAAVEGESASQTKANETLKKAMAYVKYSPYPDSLTFRFLNMTAPLATTSPENFLKYWQVFEQRYPTSALLHAVRLQLADALQQKGDNAAALAKLGTISGNTIIAGTGQWRKANLLMEIGQTENGVQGLKDYLLNFPKHPYQAKGYAKLAEYYQSMGDYETAAQFWDRLATLYDYADEAENARNLAVENYLRSGDDERALAYLTPQLQKYQLVSDPVLASYLAIESPETFYYAGSARYRQNDFNAARGYLLQYLKLADTGEKQSETLLLLGKMAQAEQDNEAALLQLALIKKADDPSIFYQANEISADILFEEKKYTEALRKYDMLISENANAEKMIDYEGQKLRCLVNLGSGSLNSQLTAFRQKYGKLPKADDYLAAVEYESAKVDFTAKSFDQSINHCKTILSKYKQTEYADDAQFLIGRNYTTLNKGDKALEEFEKFLKNYPKSDLTANVYLTIAEIYFRDEETEAGVTAVRRAVDVASNPETQQQALASLISTYKSLQLWDGALQNAREYVQKFPNADDIVDQKITIGIALNRLNRFSEAVDYLKDLKFSVNSDQEPEIQFYIGEAYFNGGQYEQAINEFVKIPLLSQKTKLQWEASALYFAGQSYEKLGRTNEAVRMYQEIIDRPGIQLELKRQARKLIDNIKSVN